MCCSVGIKMEEERNSQKGKATWREVVEYPSYHLKIGSPLISVFVLSYQLKLIKMRAEFASLNPCAVPFLSRAGVNLSWYDCT